MVDDQELQRTEEAPVAPSSSDVDIDAAMDAAYDRVMGGADPDDVPVSTEGDEKPASEARDRDPDTGRFVSKQSDDDTKTSDDEDGEQEDEVKAEEASGEDVDEDASEESEDDETTDDAIEPPRSWPRAMHGVWEKMSPEEREFVSNRDQQFQERFTEQGRELKAYEPLGKVVNDNLEFFKQAKQHPAQVFQGLLTEYFNLHKDPATTLTKLAGWAKTDLDTLVAGQDPRSAVTRWVQQGRLSTEDLMDLGLSDIEVKPAQQNSAPAPDPRISELEAQLRQATQRIDELQQGVQPKEPEPSAQETELLSAIERATQKYPDFADLSQLINAYLPEVRNQNPALTPDDWLTLARDRAAETVERRASQLADERIKDTTSQAEKAKRAKAANIKGNGANGKSAPLTLDQEVDRKWDEMGLPRH